MSLLIEVEVVAEALARDLERIEKAVRMLEMKGNESAAYEARAWKISLGRLYLELDALIKALQSNELLEARAAACSLKKRAYSLYSTVRESPYLFIARPSTALLTSLIGLASRICSEG